MGDFDVFDEWGNFVGKFTPAVGGFGCLFGIAILVLLAAGFVIYQFIKMVVMGFVALSKGRWGEALMYWFFPGLLTIFFTLGIAGSVAGAVVRENQRQESQEAVENEVRWALNHPDSILTFTRVGSVQSYPGCDTACMKVRRAGEYQVTNNLSFLTLRLAWEPGGYYACGSSFTSVTDTLSPKQTVTVYCDEGRYIFQAWEDFGPMCVEAGPIPYYVPESVRESSYNLSVKKCLDH